MTHTIQPLSQVTIENAKNAGKNSGLTAEEENLCDIMELCDSLNKLCETLGKLEHAMAKRNNETDSKKQTGF